MAKRLMDADKKRIIADRVSGSSLRELAVKYGVSSTTIHNVVNRNPDIEQMLSQKKEENTQDVLAYLESQTGSLKRLGDYILDERLDPFKNKDELKKVPIRELVTSYGIMVDKMLKGRELSARIEPDKGKGDADKIVSAMADLADIIRSPVADRELPEDE